MSPHPPALQVRQAPPQARGIGLGIAVPSAERLARRKTVTFDDMLEVQEYPLESSATVSTSATLSAAPNKSVSCSQSPDPCGSRSASISSQPDVSQEAQQVFGQLASSPRLGSTSPSSPPGRPMPPPLDTSIDATRDAGPPISLRGQTPPPLREAKRSPQPGPEKVSHTQLTSGADAPLLSPLERMLGPRAPRVSAGLGQLGTGLGLPDWVGMSRLSEQDEESTSGFLPSATLGASTSNPDIPDVEASPSPVKVRPRRSRSIGTPDSPLKPEEENAQLPSLPRVGGEEFSHGLQRELSRIQKRQYKYKVRSRKTISVRDTDLPPPRPASPVKLAHGQVGLSQSSATTAAPQVAPGKIFVRVDSFSPAVPFDKETRFELLLDNGRNKVQTQRRFLLQDTTELRQEFELQQVPGLRFRLGIQVLPPPKARAPPPPRPASAERPPVEHAPSPTRMSPPPSPKKEKFLSRLLRSPKKKRLGLAGEEQGRERSASPTRAPPAYTPAPTPAATSAPAAKTNPIHVYLASGGNLGQAELEFDPLAQEAMGQLVQRSVHVLPATGRGQRGTLRLSLFFVPSVPGLGPRTPARLRDCEAGIALARQEENVCLTGTLTQGGMGGSAWRRRRVELRGERLLAQNEVTGRTVMDLSLQGARVDGLEENEAGLEWAFRLQLADGEEVEFLADSAQERTRWIEALRKTLEHPQGGAAPEWARETLLLAQALKEGRTTLAKVLSPPSLPAAEAGAEQAPTAVVASAPASAAVRPTAPEVRPAAQRAGRAERIERVPGKYDIA